VKRSLFIVSLATTALSLLFAPLAFARSVRAGDLSPIQDVSLAAAPQLHAGPVLSAASPVLALADASVMAPDPDVDLAGYAALLLERIGSGDYVVAAALALMGVVFLLRRFGARIHPLLGSGKAAVVLTLLAGVGGAVANALLAGAPLTLALVLKGVMVALTSMGLFSGAKAITQAEDAGSRAAAEVGGKQAALAAIESGRQ
jgi:hypothetical protein